MQEEHKSECAINSQLILPSKSWAQKTIYLKSLPIYWPSNRMTNGTDKEKICPKSQTLNSFFSTYNVKGYTFGFKIRILKNKKYNVQG